MEENSFVLPSGVRITQRYLTGADQGTLTRQNSKSGADKFNEMLLNCTMSIGDKTKAELTIKDIAKLLSNDRKYALIELRQFSMEYQEFFELNYEWPSLGGKKHMQYYKFEFTKESFEMTPYKWVADKMKADKDTGEAKGDLTDAYPEIYSTYDEMLADQKEQVVEIKLTDTESVSVHYTLPDGIQEALFAGKPIHTIDSNTKLELYQPTIKEEAESGSIIPIKWEVKQARISHLESFRSKIREVEGFIDTQIELKNDKDPSEKASADLINTVDFFFPSQAI